MIVRNGPLAAAGGNDGYVCRLRQLDEGAFRVRARHAATGEYERHARPGDDVGDFLEIVPARHNPRDTRGVPQFDFLALHPDLGRNLDQNGTRTARSHLPERFEHGIRHVAGPVRLALPLGHRTYRALLFHHLVNGPDVLADCAARDLPGNEENRRRAGVRIGQAGRRIVKTHSRNHQGDPRFSRYASKAVHHIRRRLFVPGRDHVDARLVAQRGDDAVHLYPRNSEYDVHALPDERFHERFAAAHFSHWAASSIRQYHINYFKWLNAG